MIVSTDKRNLFINFIIFSFFEPMVPSFVLTIVGKRNIIKKRSNKLYKET